MCPDFLDVYGEGTVAGQVDTFVVFSGFFGHFLAMFFLFFVFF